MNSAARPAAVTNLMIRNLKAGLEVLVDRYNKVPSTLNLKRIQAVRREIAET